MLDKKVSLNPNEEAHKFSATEITELAKFYSGIDVPFSISEDINGKMTGLKVNYVEAYKTRYENFQQAIRLCNDIIEEEKDAMLEIEEMCAIARKNMPSVLEYQEVLQKESIFDGMLKAMLVVGVIGSFILILLMIIGVTIGILIGGM